MIALNSIQEFWAFSDWHIKLCIQTFIEYKLLKPLVVISWVFKNLDKNSLKPFEDSFYWEIIENVMDKAATKLESLKEELKRV